MESLVRRDRFGPVGAPKALQASPIGSSTGSCPGWTSTSVCLPWLRTRRCPCWSGPSSVRSSARTSTSSSRSGWPGCRTRWRPGSARLSPDGLTPSEQLAAVAKRVAEVTDRLEHMFLDDLAPALAEVGIRFSSWHELDEDDRAYMVDGVRAADLPGADPARRRSRTSVPVHLDAVAEPGRGAPRSGHHRATIRPGQGAVAAAPLRGDARRRAVRSARAGDRRAPGSAVPRHGHRGPVRVPRRPATPTSRSRRRRPTTCSPRSSSSCGAGASVLRSASRSTPE